MLTKEQLTARQALIDSMAVVSIVSPEQMADMVLDELEDRGFTIKKSSPPNETEQAISFNQTLFKELQTLVGHVDGINDERDSVPILLAVRDVVNRALSENQLVVGSLDEFDEARIKEIAANVVTAPIESAGLSANDLLDDDEAALLALQIELAISQVLDLLRAKGYAIPVAQS